MCKGRDPAAADVLLHSSGCLERWHRHRRCSTRCRWGWRIERAAPPWRGWTQAFAQPHQDKSEKRDSNGRRSSKGWGNTRRGRRCRQQLFRLKSGGKNRLRKGRGQGEGTPSPWDKRDWRVVYLLTKQPPSTRREARGLGGFGMVVGCLRISNDFKGFFFRQRHCHYIYMKKWNEIPFSPCRTFRT